MSAHTRRSLTEWNLVRCWVMGLGVVIVVTAGSLVAGLPLLLIDGICESSNSPSWHSAVLRGLEWVYLILGVPLFAHWWWHGATAKIRSKTNSSFNS